MLLENESIRKRKVRFFVLKIPFRYFLLEIYHITWNVPSSYDIEENLVQLEEYSEKNMIVRLKNYRRYDKFLFQSIHLIIHLRNIDGIKDCFKSILRSFNADQPVNDVFSQVYAYTIKKPRSIAPLTPRIVILGPTGSGRKTVAMKIARKYDIPIGKKQQRIDHIRDSLVLVSIPMLIKQQIADKTPIGTSMKPYVTRQSLGKRLISIENNRKEIFFDSSG